MAQKRNPVSLRLQTRLQGHEKRFASCWFTDFFFPQTCTNDLLKRLYLGHLLQKGGSWYSEKSEYRVPETCVAIQFLYRRCSIFSVILDKRKEEYVLSNSLRNIRVRRETTPPLAWRSPTTSRQENETPFGKGGARVGETALYLNHENTFLSTDDVAVGQIAGLQNLCSSAHEKEVFSLSETQPLAKPVIKEMPSWTPGVVTEKGPYITIANSFSSTLCKHAYKAPPLLKKARKSSTELTDLFTKADQVNDDLINTVRKADRWIFLPAFQNTVVSQKLWRDLFRTTSRQYNLIPGSAYIAAIELICELSGKAKKTQNQNTANKINIVGKDHAHSQRLSDLTKSFAGERSYLDTSQPKSSVSSTVVKSSSASVEKASKPAFHWTSLSFIRGVSSCQSIEFCLYSVISLYKKRFSFLQIKETLFKMLEANGKVRGARLVCSGRQGGRSKSAMRAKKQSALWGQTALSLFSSRLAFASTGIDTSFGQIGIKIWVCYK